MSRAPLLAAALVVAGCADGRSLVTITVDASPQLKVETLRLTVTDVTRRREAAPVIVAVAAPGTIPPQQTVALVFSPEVRGPIDFLVDGITAGQIVGSARSQLDVQPSLGFSLTLVLQSGAAPGDMAGGDQALDGTAGLDLSSMDRAVPPDGVVLDLQTPDLSGDCEPGKTTRLPCPMCGTMSATCGNNRQWSYGICEGQGECAAGTKGGEVACGYCGKTTRTCTDSCLWANGPCANEGVCAENTRKTENCGNCGTRTDVCSNVCQWVVGSCAGQGCKPDSVQQGSCGDCSEQACGKDCKWGACHLKSGSKCNAGEMQACNCTNYNCAGQRFCQNCQWGHCHCGRSGSWVRCDW